MLRYKFMSIHMCSSEPRAWLWLVCRMCWATRPPAAPCLRVCFLLSCIRFCPSVKYLMAALPFWSGPKGDSWKYGDAMYGNQTQITCSTGGIGISSAFNKFKILEDPRLDEQYSACFVLIWTVAVSELVMGEESVQHAHCARPRGAWAKPAWDMTSTWRSEWELSHSAALWRQTQLYVTQSQFMGPRREQAGGSEAAFANKLSVPKGEVFTAITVLYLCAACFSLHLHLDLPRCY